MNHRQIGRCGELLVQYKLLLLGIESAPMTTDSGIDLAAFSATDHKVLTIQVKANEQPKRGGGKGRLALDWWIDARCPAEAAAMVDLSTNTVWVFTMLEVAKFAQQHSSGRHHLYMYVDPKVALRSGRLARVSDFDAFLLERRLAGLFA